MHNKIQENTIDNRILNESDKGYERTKRFLDVVVSVVLLVILFVPMAVVALIIVIDSPGASPIYMQERVGLNGKTFRLYKFRSMVPNAEKQLNSLLSQNEMQGPAFKMKNDPRITRFGRLIRKVCVDELPQLVNILKGEMSFVGPRPPLPREVDQYTDFQKQRLTVIPGLTCYWQIKKNRNDCSFDEWLELDLKYIEERSVKTDVVIFFKTFGAVLGMEGI